jgi:hypothetical protein
MVTLFQFGRVLVAGASAVAKLPTLLVSVDEVFALRDRAIRPPLQSILGKAFELAVWSTAFPAQVPAIPIAQIVTYASAPARVPVQVQLAAKALHRVLDPVAESLIGVAPHCRDHPRSTPSQ